MAYGTVDIGQTKNPTILTLYQMSLHVNHNILISVPAKLDQFPVWAIVIFLTCLTRQVTFYSIFY